MTRYKYRIFISDYQPFRFFKTLTEAKQTLKAEGLPSFVYYIWNDNLKMYTTPKTLWL